MLIYEKKVTEGDKQVNKLFGTKGNVPSADDAQLSYKDNAGEAIANVDEIKYLYEKEKDMYGSTAKDQIPKNTDEKINVWLGDTLVIGTVAKSKVSVTTIENVVITINDTAPTEGIVEVATGAEATISISAAEGYAFADGGEPTAAVGEDSISLTEDGGVYTGSIGTVSNDISITVTATVEAE